MRLTREELKAKKDAAISALFSLNRASKNASYALLDLIDYIESAGLDASDMRAAYFGSVTPGNNQDGAASFAPTLQPTAADTPVKAPSANAAKGATPTRATPGKTATPRTAAGPRSVATPRFLQNENEPEAGLKEPETPNSAYKPAPTRRVSKNVQSQEPSKDEQNGSGISDAAEEKPVKKTRKRAQRDPNAPKRPLSAFLKFRNEIAAENRAKGHPPLSWDALNTAVKERWEALTDDERNSRKDQFLKQVVEFHENMERYNASQEQNSQLEESSQLSSQAESSQAASSQPQGSQATNGVPPVVTPVSSQTDQESAPPKKKHKKDKKSKEKEKEKSKEK